MSRKTLTFNLPDFSNFEFLNHPKTSVANRNKGEKNVISFIGKTQHNCFGRLITPKTWINFVFVLIDLSVFQVVWLHWKLLHPQSDRLAFPGIIGV